MSDTKKMVFIHTSGPDTPERMATPFYLATAAALMDCEATMVFTIRGTALLKKGVSELVSVKEGAGATLRTFLEQAVDAGVKLLVCAPSLDLNDMKPEDLIDEVDGIIGGTALNDLVLEADGVLTF